MVNPIFSSSSENDTSLDAITCLSRNDPNKDIFKKVKKTQKKKRRNFYNLVDIKDGTLSCQNKTFKIQNICVNDAPRNSKICTLKNTNNEVVELDHLA